jgi:hypothetical protein
MFDGEELWNLTKDLPERHYPTVDGYICPSDWRYREDLTWLKRNCLEYAGAWKLRKEVQQRKDRTLRQEAKKLREKGEES